MEWIEAYKIPIGDWAQAVVDWLTLHGAWFFDGLSAVLAAVIGALLWCLQTPHPLIVIALATALAWWLRRSLGFAAFVAAGLLLIVNQGYWEETTETLALVLASTIVCMGIGVPIGIAAARRPWLFTALQPVLDLMQTIPTFVYLIPALIPSPTWLEMLVIGVFHGVVLVRLVRARWAATRQRAVELESYRALKSRQGAKTAPTT